MVAPLDEKHAAMADERTPLIQVVPVAERPPRYPHHNLRRACTYVLAIVPAIVLGAVLASIFILPPYFPGDKAVANDELAAVRSGGYSISRSWPQSDGLSFDELEDVLLTVPSAAKAREWSEFYTAGPHLAGKNISQAIWTKEKWQEFGVPNVELVAYDTYLNYPLGHRLALLEKSKESKRAASSGHADAWKVAYEASLEEDILEEDPTSGLEDRIPTFHGYSASGNVTAPYVYVNYGTYQDYEDLLKANVTLKGKIALAKYGGIFRGLKIKRAEDLGMVGAVLYSDPGDDGEVTELNGYKAYPEGPARNPSSVQRGSAQFLSFAPGDPTTPGYPSKPGVPRDDVKGKIPSIPSVPISYTDALPLLKALNGHGPKADDFGKYWKGGGLGHKGVEYNIGPSPDTLVLNLVNEQEYVTTPQWDVIGIINGTIPDEVIVLGNHRDAWIAGGAGDPNSGSAAFNELIRAFGIALSKGWKPLRTIVFASWDGEEYGLIGSTEWVEEYLPWLTQAAVAYINVDVGATGPHFGASAAPLLDGALIEATLKVQSPNQTVEGQTVGDVWNKHISTMGSGSDFTAFQDFAGIPCIDLGFKPDEKSAVYHYHSNYDSFAWMDRFGDPGFQYHETIAKVFAVLAAKLIESPVIQFNATNYAVGLQRYLKSVEDKAAEVSASGDSKGVEDWDIPALFAPIEKAIAKLHKAATHVDAAAADLEDEIANNPIPWWKWWKKIKLYYKVRAINIKYKYLERQFLFAGGLDGRPWFKHVVFAPGLWTGYAGATFPGLVEAVEAGDKASAEKWAGIVKGLIYKAAGTLKG
ncbi:putative glutamate carboxypeptidase protein [Neofusicoccum parvum UCRNP2]|uniref:Putative glutamate carboxypeptidase protein n=1 Tax=Botryosphaeria parva (strain UCR-NP2) TaxID=1287680 RepID=R1FXA8_BOTPV|nr:putative glutamate carboxypeptidase protein [Neofusicoccum parvum UCRNP2]